ncbi:MAG: hypothetical protein R3C53_09005 [Pirellulaceae bacterium]
MATSLIASDNATGAAQEVAVAETILREGTRIESKAGECRSDGERLAITFNDGKSHTMIALENLAAQRILQAVSDDSNDKGWIVTGSVTEFQGRNFILLERVTRVSK